MRNYTVLIIFVAASLTNACGQSITLGILEENAGHYAGESNYRDVRVVFQKKDNEWRTFPSDCNNQDCLKTISRAYPGEVAWTVTFDGKNIGQVASRTRTDFKWYGDIGQQEITSKEPVPTIGTRSREFGGYGEATVYRPLVANSQPYFNDPDKWKPFVVTPELTHVLQASFRKKFPKLCHLSEVDHSTLEPLPYRNLAVKVVKAYASVSGWMVARLHLEAVDCADTEAGFDIDDPWFVVDPKKSTEYLDSGMWLVDAGDYDNDGKSELVFSINRENQGGYEIYYDDFKKHASFQFNYH